VTPEWLSAGLLLLPLATGKKTKGGVDVRLMADKTTPCGRANGIEPPAAAGVSDLDRRSRRRCILTRL